MTDDIESAGIGISGPPRPSAIRSGIRVLAIDIHTSDGTVKRLTEFANFELLIFNRNPRRIGKGAIARKCRMATILHVEAEAVTEYVEPAPAKKKARRK